MSTMMTAMANEWREHLRLGILRLLDEQPRYQANTSILHGALSRLGIGGSRDQVETEVTWLRDQGAVTVQDLEVVRVVTLSSAGAEVARGERTMPGVRRPAPRA